MHPGGGSHAKLVVLPGNNILAPAGATQTFQMAVPVAFMGIRLVINPVDVVTNISSTALVLSVRHDNVELIANGRLGNVLSFIFAPPIMNAFVAPAGVALTSPVTTLTFKEWFDIGDIFSITLRSPPGVGLPSRIECYWITDYGTTCGNNRAMGKTCA